MKKGIFFGDRKVECRNAHESNVGLLECPNGHKEHGRDCIAMRVDATAPAGRAFYGSYSASDARGMAAFLLELADEIDGGAGKQ